MVAFIFPVFVRIKSINFFKTTLNILFLLDSGFYFHILK